MDGQRRATARVGCPCVCCVRVVVRAKEGGGSRRGGKGGEIDSPSRRPAPLLRHLHGECVRPVSVAWSEW